MLTSLALTATVAACGGAPPLPPVVKPAPKKLAVLPAESDSFPKAAKAATSFLGRARVRGFDEPSISKVSLEVVQLSIECVESTTACYEAVGKSLSVNQILFAEIDRGRKPKQLKVTVTLFDVDAGKPMRSAEKLFDDEEDAELGIGDVVAEVTK